jgi:hypothetical protein
MTELQRPGLLLAMKAGGRRVDDGASATTTVAEEPPRMGSRRLRYLPSCHLPATISHLPNHKKLTKALRNHLKHILRQPRLRRYPLQLRPHQRLTRRVVFFPPG